MRLAAASASRRLVTGRRLFATEDDVPAAARVRASGVARATIIGNVGSDAKITKFEDGGVVGQFSLALSVPIKRADGTMEAKTEWYLAVSRTQSVVETFEKIIKKGMMIFVEGPLEIRDFTDKATGQPKKTVAVRINNASQFKILRYPYDPERYNGSGGGQGNAKGGNGVFDGKDNGQVYD